MVEHTKKKQIIGIINCTPDSYFEKGRFQDPHAAIEYGLHLLQEGADILDIGGESTRPDSNMPVSEEEEMRRVLPVIKGLRQQTRAILSIDTFKPVVAQAALDSGADWINDITGLSNSVMQQLAIKSGATCCIMHMPGAPYTLPNFHYPNGVVETILDFFKKQTAKLLAKGILPNHIILDPGIGGGAFGKTPDQNLEILRKVSSFSKLGFPVLISLSRKSFLQKILKKSSSELLSTTLALNTMALLEGATFIRVHDVAAHKDILTILERMEALI